MDRMLCDDILRNAKYTIQRHDTRKLLTVNGPVHFNREYMAAGWEEIGPKFGRGYLKKLLHGRHDSARVYLERMQATIPGVEIRKKLAIRERLSNI